MDKLNQILKDIFDISPGSIDKNFNFRDLGSWDSMAYILLVSRIETDFSIQLNGDEILRLLSISQIEEVLKEKKVF